MSTLEEEFNKLIEGVHNTIRAKQVAGEITRGAADDLTRMVEERLGNGMAPEPRGGWQASSWCYDDGWDSSNC